MYFGMRRSTVISFTLHAAIILAAIIALPTPQLPTAEDSGISVQFGPSVPQHSTQTGKTPAPSKSPTIHKAPAADHPTKPQPIEPPPPVAPPPPDAPPKPPTTKPPVTPPPTPPPVPVPTLSTLPPPPPVPPKPPQKVTTVTPPNTLPPPPPTQPPQPAQSTMHQRHVVQTPDELSHTVLNTINKLKAEQKQDKPPTHVYNPDAGGAPDAGGDPNSPANSQLSGADKNAIASEVRPCFDVDSQAEGLNGFSVLLDVETDPTGIIRKADVDPKDSDKLTDPIFSAFADRAKNAVLNYQCSDLSKILPANMLGQNQTFIFNFTGQ